MPVLALPKSFFVRERNDVYGRWHIAFWRELVSNSIDAGASRIQIRTSYGTIPGGDGTEVFEVTFADNGCGMNRETLEDVYFKLGASTKGEGSSGVGGFGRARILTCFSHVAYYIRTLDCEVTGDGAEYSLTSGLPRQPGCTVVVGIDRKEAERLEEGLRKFLQECQLDCELEINGERYQGWGYKGRVSRQLVDEAGNPFANVHVSYGEKARNKGRLIVRVNGVSMFTPWVRDLDAQVIVEVSPERSRAILTGSRDNFRSPYSDILDRFTQELASDRSKMLRVHDEVSVQVYRGAGIAAATPGSYAGIRSGSTRESTGLWAPAPAGSVGASESAGGISPIRLPADLPDMVVRIASPNAASKRSLVRFLPENWTRASGEGSSARILYAMWVAACEHAIAALLRVRPGLGEVRYMPGFYFDTPEDGASYTRGLHSTVAIPGELDRRTHAILLNPLDDKGRLLYSATSKSDRKTLIAVAKHEAAHVVEESHDQDFASLLTFIDAAFDERLAFQRMDELASRMRSAFGRKALVQQVTQAQRAAPQPPAETGIQRPWERRLAADHPMTMSMAGLSTPPIGRTGSPAPIGPVAAAVATSVADTGRAGVVAVDATLVSDLERLFAEGAESARRRRQAEAEAGDEKPRASSPSPGF